MSRQTSKAVALLLGLLSKSLRGLIVRLPFSSLVRPRKRLVRRKCLRMRGFDEYCGFLGGISRRVRVGRVRVA